jgi:hypothetical protein
MIRDWSVRLYVPSATGLYDCRSTMHGMVNTSIEHYDLVKYVSIIFSHVPDTRFLPAEIEGDMKECIQVKTQPLIDSGFQLYTSP